MNPSLQLGLKIDNAALSKTLSKAPDALVGRIRALVEGAAIDVSREERIQAPVAVTGQLRGGISYVLDLQNFTANVAPIANYAADVQNGSQPKLVSVKEGTPLRKWADLKGANPYEVQAAIAKRGTKANPYATRTFNRMQPVVQQNMATGIDALVKEIDSGGL